MVRMLMAFLLVMSGSVSASAQQPVASPEADGAAVSVMLIQKSLPELSQKHITASLAKAWPAEFAREAAVSKVDSATANTARDANGSDKDHGFLIRTKNGVHVLISLSPRPFVDTSESDNISDLRNRTMVQKHRATVSISLAHDADQNVTSDDIAASGLVAKLAAELIDDNTLGVMLPYQEVMLAGNKELQGPLRAQDPVKALRAASRAVVLKSSDDDPRMKAAVQKARMTWSEFEKAFRLQAKNTESFNVKFPFAGDGETEFMWVEVTSIQNDVVTGKLGNEPVQIRTLKLGDVVQKNISELADWMYLRDGELTGGFTVQVLVDQEAEKSQPRGRRTDE